MFRKVSVFVLVVAFHLLVLGVVYLSTREPSEDVTTEEVAGEESKSNDNNNSSDKSTNTLDKNSNTSDKSPKSSASKSKPSSDAIVHVVKEGDFLGKIATKYKVSAKDIMELNNLSDPNKIFLNQKIKIPSK